MPSVPDLVDRLSRGESATPREIARWPQLELHRLRPRDPGPGAVYTPAGVAFRLAKAMGPLPPTGLLLDPACGSGALLVALVRQAAGATARLDIARRLVGCDLDLGALDRAQAAIALAVIEEEPDTPLDGWGPTLADLRLADGLLAELPSASAIILNPPYQDASAMTAEDRPRRAALALRFSVCRGNWDLWCPFVERALELATPGASIGLLIPDKVQQAPYAAEVRRRLGHGRHSLRPLGRATTAAIDLVQIIARGGPVGLDSGEPWISAVHPGATPLADLAQLLNAATVKEAYQIAEALVERPSPEPGDLRLLTTGAIDPGLDLWGEKPQRYLKRRWLHPVLPRTALPSLHPRLARFRRPKIIIGGLGRRLEAVFDPDGTILPAKSTVVLIPRPGVDGRRLTQAINAPETSERWRARAHGLALSGGYLRVTIDVLSRVGVDWRIG